MVAEKSTPRDSTRAIGAVRIQLQSAHLVEPGIRSLRPLPNPYVEISINNTQLLGRSEQICRTLDPYWSQAFYALIQSSQDVIVFSVLSRRQCWRTRLVGTATYTTLQLEREPFHLGINERLWKRQKERGSILFDVLFYKPIKTSVSENDSTMGIVTLTVYEGRNLWCQDIPGNQLRPIVTVRLDLDEATLQATPFGFSSNPQWHSQCEILAVEGRQMRAVLEVKDGRQKGLDLGHISLPLVDVLGKEGQEGRWWPLSGSPSGQLKLKFEWTTLATDQESIVVL